MTDYHDGIYSQARRNYTPSGRSWHIPAESEFRRPSFVIIVLASVLAAVSLVGMVMR